MKHRGAIDRGWLMDRLEFRWLPEAGTILIISHGNSKVGAAKGLAAALETLGDEGVGKQDFRAVGGLDEGVHLASFD